MKIHFSKKEYRLLLDMIQIAGWVLNAHSVDKEDFKATEHYQALSQKIKAYAKEAGCEDLITFDKTLEQYFATYDYEMEGEYMEFVKAFEEDSFWEHLIQKLAERDFLDQTPESVGEKMSNEEVMIRLEEHRGPYEEEFSEYGIDNLQIVKTSEKIIH